MAFTKKRERTIITASTAEQKNDKNRQNKYFSGRNNPDQHKPGGSPQPPEKGPGPGRNIIWIILLSILFLYFATFLFQSDGLRLSYTKFKELAGKDKIASITVKGDTIQGKFRDAYQPKESEAKYEFFNSVKPAFQDESLIQLLEEHDITVNAESTQDSWLSSFLIFILPIGLLILYFWWLSRSMRGKMNNMMGGGGIFSHGKSRAKKYKREDGQVTFDDVAGLKNAKRDLQEIVEYLKHPEKFSALGANIPKGVLLKGAPGIGKTMLARATAGEAEVPFFSISGSEFIEMFVGVGASRVRDMFQNAKNEAPAVIFIDEIDSIGRYRGAGVGGGHDEREQTLNQILSEMDGFETRTNVVVIAATNRPDILDPALTRPGRFDRQIVLNYPQRDTRKGILEIHSKNVPLSKNADLDKLAGMTTGLTGADLKNLVNEAALLAGRRNKKKVAMEDLEDARDKVLLGDIRDELINENEKRAIAYHEAGHTIIAKILPNTDPVQKVTIIPRGQALGATEQVPDEDRHHIQKSYLLDRITVTLGGRAAETLIFNENSNGAANDLKVITNLAEKMVCQWGMSDAIGPVTFSRGEEHVFLGREMTQKENFSQETAHLIDQEVQKIIKECEKRALSLLRRNRKQLDALTEALIEKETLGNAQIEEILGPLKKETGTKSRSKSNSKTGSKKTKSKKTESKKGNNRKKTSS